MADGYEDLKFNEGTGHWDGYVIGNLAEGNTVEWLIWAIDKKSNNTFSEMHSFIVLHLD